MKFKRISIVLTLALGLTLVAIIGLGGLEKVAARPAAGIQYIFPDNCPGATLQDCINSAIPGGVIIISDSVKTYGSENLTIKDKGISLIGTHSASTTITAPAGKPVLTISGEDPTKHTVVISGITIAGGRATGGTTCPTYCGGGIQIIGKIPLIMHNVVISDNHASRHGGGMYAAIEGLLQLDNVDFVNNKAENNGGAATFGGGAFIASRAIITGGLVEGNTSGNDGGGLFALTLTMSGTTFNNNRNIASGHGGGLYVLTATVTNGHFTHNRARDDGGGLYAASELTLTHVTFFSNTAGRDGGGAFASFVLGRVISSYFAGNRAEARGGGVYAGQKLHLTDTTFVTNSALTQGGGAFSQGPILATGGRFDRNACTATGCHGGGLYVDSSLAMTYTMFLTNMAAGHGGGLYVDSTLTMSGTQFRGNMAGNDGGGIFAPSKTAKVTIISSTISSNTAAERGGGLFANNTLLLTHTHFISNTAGGDGGGAATFEAAPITLKGGRFAGNVSGARGGGLYADSVLVMTGTEFIRNSAKTFGGGAFIAIFGTLINGYFERNICGPAPTDCLGGGGGLHVDNSVILTETTFISNTAVGQGGGANVASALMISGGRFENNRCTGTNPKCPGGGLYTSILLLERTRFISNAAQGDGGGLFAFATGAITATDAYFARNTANRGGGLHADNRVAITNSQFISNEATAEGGGIFATGIALVARDHFTQNKTSSDGGGLYTADALTLKETVFSHNEANKGGGIFQKGNGERRIMNVLLANNTAATSGAGLYFKMDNKEVKVNVLHATISNVGVNPKAAIVVEKGKVNIQNTLIASHMIGIDRQISDEVEVPESFNLYDTVTYPITDTASPLPFVILGPGSQTGPANFVDSANGNYRLGANSAAALDKGIPVGVSIDIEGTTRPQSGGFDIGAYEWTPHPAIAVTKVADVETAPVGQLLTYAYKVTNIGDVTLNTVRLSDNQLGNIKLVTDTLLPGKMTTRTATYRVNHLDSPGALINTATATGKAPGGKVVFAVATEVVQVSTTPLITITKTPHIDVALLGQTITYTYRLTNIGNIDLNGVRANDDRLGAVPLGQNTLARGEGMSSFLTYRIAPADWPGPVINKVTAESRTPFAKAEMMASVALKASQIFTFTLNADPTGPSLAQALATADDSVSLFIPGGALLPSVGGLIYTRPATSTSAPPAALAGLVFQLGLNNKIGQVITESALNTPATLTIHYDPALLPPDTVTGLLTLLGYNPQTGQWTEMAIIGRDFLNQTLTLRLNQFSAATEFVLVSTEAQTVTFTINPTQNTFQTLSSPDKTFAMTLPPGTLPANAKTIVYTKLATPTVMPPGAFAGQVFKLSLNDTAGQGIANAPLNPPATITILYDPAQLPPGAIEGLLAVMAYNPTTGRWEKVPLISHDFDRKTLTLQLGQLTAMTEFVLVIPDAETTYLPVIF